MIAKPSRLASSAKLDITLCAPASLAWFFPLDPYDKMVSCIIQNESSSIRTPVVHLQHLTTLHGFGFFLLVPHHKPILGLIGVHLRRQEA